MNRRGFFGAIAGVLACLRGHTEGIHSAEPPKPLNLADLQQAVDDFAAMKAQAVEEIRPTLLMETAVLLLATEEGLEFSRQFSQEMIEDDSAGMRALMKCKREIEEEWQRSGLPFGDFQRTCRPMP